VLPGLKPIDFASERGPKGPRFHGSEYSNWGLLDWADMTEPNRRLVEQIFQSAKFIESLGIELTDVGVGWCETKLKAAPRLQQQHGFLHAGVLMTIADHTCGGAAASTMPEGKDVITVENKVSFLRPASGAVLYCRAEVLRTGKSLVFVEAEVSAERDDGRVMVAKASSTLAVIPLKGDT
jgi:uncharacterized protein (TIGR00369 family)